MKTISPFRSEGPVWSEAEHLQVQSLKNVRVSPNDLDRVRAATRKYLDVPAAAAAGYVNVNVGECVESPEGVMGYHFLKEDLLDLELSAERPT